MRLSDAIAVVVAMALILLAGWLAVSNSGLRADLAEARAQSASVTAANVQWESAGKALEAELADCNAQWASVQSDLEDAVELVNAFRAENVRQHQEFERRWAARTGDCDVALQGMQAACAESIGDY